ncbi:hypothetical protein SAMN05216188_1304 [Lentzea xinjiangensis]|uniref:NB-ARC domain-containing protein n=1 Tax=Lentzea xinjiangensis TaxID=402600 RepID=A0A1H9W1P2_9PSEU|nr:ATP-binding protein [Lentzea xinjiangensis]SES27836.1 hypothetical protein SAMN05216188_1304 [Lentzea xinjiangensis]
MTNSFTGHSNGPVFQARDVHGDVLFAGSAPRALAGLPQATGTFVGRDEELRLLRDVRCAVVSGLAGVGKTQLVLHAARRAERPGGELFVDLRGYDEDSVVGPAEALDKFLRDLGVAGEHIPPGTDQRAGLYRSVLARAEPMVIVLDNASSTAQVAPLLPGTSAHRVLITSRNVLVGLDDAEPVVLGTLADAHAAELVGDPDLAALCGNLPLALRIMAALRKHHPEVDWVAELRRTDPLEVLDDGDTRSVDAAFDLSYRFLAADERRLFRLLALHPGDEIAEEGARALAGLPPARTGALLRRLVRAHLLERGQAPGTYRFHDLVRLHARRCLADETATTVATRRSPAFSTTTSPRRRPGTARWARWRTTAATSATGSGRGRGWTGSGRLSSRPWRWPRTWAGTTRSATSR